MRFPDDVPVLSDGRVTLRAHQPADVDAVYEQCLDEQMQRFTLVPVPYDHKDAAAYCASRRAGWESGSTCSFAIEALDGSGPTRFAGSIELRAKGVPGVAGVAFGGHPAARGHGVMSAAVGLLADWAFHERSVQRLGWGCIAGNLASWRTVWRNGFGFEGSTRLSQHQRGTLLDSWHASLLATDNREPKTRWLPVPRLSDGRVLLRPVEGKDEERYLQTVHDRDSDLWLADVPLSRDSASFWRQVRDAGLAPSLGLAVQWAIADAATDEYVGGLGMFDFQTLDHLSAEVGYRSHPDARGRGYVSAALRLALGQAFEPEGVGGYGLQRVSLGAGNGNVASQAVARACGFQQTGRDRRCYRLSDGRAVDLVRFDLLAEEWASRPGTRADAAANRSG